MRRPWTGKELATVRRLHDSTKHANIGKLLGRTKSSVGAQVRRLGLARRFRWTSHKRRVFKMLYDKGHSGDTIASHLGCSDTCVLKRLRRLGWPANGFNHTTTKKRRLAVHHIAQRHNCNNWAEVRWLHERRRTAKMGVPDAWNVSEAKLLLTLQCGPLSIEAATKMLGISQRRTSGLLLRLWHRGLVQRQPHTAKRRSRSFVYSLVQRDVS